MHRRSRLLDDDQSSRPHVLFGEDDVRRTLQAVGSVAVDAHDGRDLPLAQVLREEVERVTDLHLVTLGLVES